MVTAKVFMSGRSQAVRLPKEFRVDTKEVFITKKANDIILTPKREETKAEFDVWWEKIHAPDFEIERDLSPPQKRDLFN